MTTTAQASLACNNTRFLPELTDKKLNSCSTIVQTVLKIGKQKPFDYKQPTDAQSK